MPLKSIANGCTHSTDYGGGRKKITCGATSLTRTNGSIRQRSKSIKQSIMRPRKNQ